MPPRNRKRLEHSELLDNTLTKPRRNVNRSNTYSIGGHRDHAHHAGEPHQLYAVPRTTPVPRISTAASNVITRDRLSFKPNESVSYFGDYSDGDTLRSRRHFLGFNRNKTDDEEETDGSEDGENESELQSPEISASDDDNSEVSSTPGATGPSSPAKRSNSRSKGNNSPATGSQNNSIMRLGKSRSKGSHSRSNGSKSIVSGSHKNSAIRLDVYSVKKRHDGDNRSGSISKAASKSRSLSRKPSIKSIRQQKRSVKQSDSADNTFTVNDEDAYPEPYVGSSTRVPSSGSSKDQRYEDMVEGSDGSGESGDMVVYPDTDPITENAQDNVMYMLHPDKVITDPKFAKELKTVSGLLLAPGSMKTKEDIINQLGGVDFDAEKLTEKGRLYKVILNKEIDETSRNDNTATPKPKISIERMVDGKLFALSDPRFLPQMSNTEKINYVPSQKKSPGTSYGSEPNTSQNLADACSVKAASTKCSTKEKTVSIVSEKSSAECISVRPKNIKEALINDLLALLIFFVAYTVCKSCNVILSSMVQRGYTCPTPSFPFFW